MEPKDFVNPANPKPTLEEVRNRFETWRKGKKAGSRIPKSLWEAAIAVCSEHSILEVSRALRLNYNTLKERVDRSRVLHPEFVELSLGNGFAPLGCTVEIRSPEGATLSMSFQGEPVNLDLLALARAFWQEHR